MSAAAPRAPHRFVGRLETSEALYRRGDDARAGDGGVTLLYGETGLGKSTLVAELVERLRARGVRVLESRAPVSESPPPFFVIRETLESARATPEVTSASPLDQSPLAFVPPTHDAVLLGFAPGVDSIGTEGPVDVEERLLDALHRADEHSEGDRGRLFHHLNDQFLALARRGPTALVFEDIHLADEPSLDALVHLSRELSGRPLWILATSVPPASLSEATRGRIERWEEASGARRVVLRPLNPGEVAEYVRTIDPDRVASPEDVARLHSESGGNPIFLEQLLRAPSEGTGGGFRTPLLGHEAPEFGPYVNRLIASLDPAEERLVSVAAVVGKEMPFALLLRASGEEEEAVTEVLDRLVEKGVLTQRPDETVAFPAEEVRHQIYGTLTDARRHLWHRRVAEALEAEGVADVATIYELARHYYLARVDDKAAQYNETAAEFAVRSFAATVAREHFERALECHRRAFPDDVAREVELGLSLALQLDLLGEINEAERLARELLDRPRGATEVSPSQSMLVKLLLVRIQTDRGEWKEAEEAVAALERSADAATSPAARIALHRLHGETLYYLGRYPEALEEHDRALALARTHRFEREIALELVRTGNVLAMMPGRSAEAIAKVREASEALVRLGDNAEAAYAHLFLGVMLATEHRLDESIRELRRSVELGEESHNLRRIGWGLFNLADILRETGEFAEAHRHNRRSREILSRIGDRFGLVQVMIIEGKILLDEGALDASEMELLDAYRLVRELRTPADEVDVVLRLAQLALARGDRAGARRRVIELERSEIERLRPDILYDFTQLKARLEDAAAPADGTPA